MATIIEATLRQRTGSGALNAMRREGFVPSVIYGATENKNIKVHSKTFRDHLNTKPSSQVLIDLDVEGHGAQQVFIQDIQFDAITGEILHADFLAVKENTVLTAKLPIKLFGEPVGVKAGGQLEQLVHSTKIKSLPKNLPLQIDASVESLEIAENLTIGGIAFPEGVTPVLDSRVLVALVAKTRVATSEDAEDAAAPEQDAPDPEAEKAAEKSE
ncbi:MAG: large subunit ribosomal protein L25 [Rubritalea sp.]|jgi:large subunit ribosomal protein L25